MSRSMYRQGDLLFTQISTVPERLHARANNVITEGEGTGHSHRLLAGRVLEDGQGSIFLEVLRATQVIHPEHHAIDLPPGCYRVTRQRKYTPESLREVLD